MYEDHKVQLPQTGVAANHTCVVHVCRWNQINLHNILLNVLKLGHCVVGSGSAP